LTLSDDRNNKSFCCGYGYTDIKELFEDKAFPVNFRIQSRIFSECGDRSFCEERHETETCAVMSVLELVLLAFSERHDVCHIHFVECSKLSCILRNFQKFLGDGLSSAGQFFSYNRFFRFV